MEDIDIRVGFGLPPTVETDKVNAEYKNGVHHHPSKEGNGQAAPGQSRNPLSCI
jgi:hypothetical protein